MAEKDVKDVAPEENTVAKDIVVTKYKMAAEIVNGTVIIYLLQNCCICVTDICVSCWLKIWYLSSMRYFVVLLVNSRLMHGMAKFGDNIL